MPARSLMTQTATITTVSLSDTDDRYGNPEEATTTSTWPCLVTQLKRNEEQVDEDVLVDTWRLFLPADAPLTGYDRVTVDSIEYEMLGPPWPVHSPRLRRTDHIEAQLKRAA